MAPEVLMGRPLSEKADLYSFGIVAWELFTGREPYEQHDNYDLFVAAVCLKHERPALDKSIQRGVRDIIDSSWCPDPSKRPCMFHSGSHNFPESSPFNLSQNTTNLDLAMKELIPRIDRALVDGSLPCKVAADMWYKNWEGKVLKVDLILVRSNLFSRPKFNFQHLLRFSLKSFRFHVIY